MTDSVYFSIVTPVLNGRDFVDKFVLCLQLQIYTHWEVIIVDDGSSDGTIDLIHALVRDDRRFRVLSNPCSKQINGPYQARNHGLSLVRGDYVCFLDIDDFWHPERLLVLSRLIENASVRPVLAYSSYFRIDACRQLAFKRFSSWPMSPKFLIRFVNIVPMLTSCVSVEFLRSLDIRFLPVNHEDYIFWKTVIDRVSSPRICVDNSALAYYTMRSSSLSGNKFRALSWLMICYDNFGYSFLQKIMALASRALLEFLSAIRTCCGGSASGKFRLIPDQIRPGSNTSKSV